MSVQASNLTNTAMSDTSKKKNIPLIALIVGLVGIGIAALGLVSGLIGGDSRPWFSWLIGIAFWMSILIGSLLLIMISYVFDAGWSIIIRRQLEHLIAAFPLLALLFVPFFLVAWFSDNPGLVWKWMDLSAPLHNGKTVGSDPIFLWKSAWLDLGWMTFRTVLYFAIFVGVASLLRRFSFKLDGDGNTNWVHQARKVSAFGIFAVGLSLTFVAFDWFMSLEFHWFSTMYGVWYFSSSIRAAVAFIIILCFVLERHGYLKGIYNRAHRYDLGCLLLSFTIFWAYISFSQMFLIYQANIPEETFWYNLRLYLQDDSGYNSWWYVSMALVFLHFFLPFIVLLFYSTKVHATRLVWVAVWVLVFHVLDLYFNILPGEILTTDAKWIVRSFSVTVFDLASIIGIGGLVMWVFLRSAARTKAIPIRDPRILESLHHHE
jgi:hypothetical protein